MESLEFGGKFLGTKHSPCVSPQEHFFLLETGFIDPRFLYIRI